MKNMTLTIVAAVVVLLPGCKNEPKSENPFFTEYNTPFEVPPFDKIDTTHYMPAFLEGMEREMKDIDAIVNNSETPTFENTILAFDRSGLLLTNVSKVFLQPQ